jgi:hypothetical protein
MAKAVSPSRPARVNHAARSGLLRATALVVTAALLGGCHIQQRVTLPGAPPATAAPLVEPGDQVRIVLKDGTTVTARLVEVGPVELVTDGGRHISLADIGEIEKRQLSSGRTTALVIGIVAGVQWLVVGVATAAAYSSALGM